MTGELKLDTDPSETWGYYKNLPPGNEHDGLSEDWYEAGVVSEISLKNPDSIKELHKHLDSFNKAIVENPEDMRYEFVAVPTRTKITPANRSEEFDLLVMVRPGSDDVTLGDLRTFTARVKGETSQ